MKTDREKLIEVIKESFSPCHEDLAEIIAKHLISKGVTIPVRCGECKHFDIEDWLGVRTYRCKFAIVEFDVNPNTYCAYGERKEE